MLTGAELEATAFYLRATAGVRLLERQNPTLVTALMAAVVNASASQPLLNSGDDDSAAVLTGGDEGAFGWTAANYLEGTLNPAVEALQSGGGMRAVRQLQTTAALDLGGASTQISFVPAEEQPPPEDAVRLDLYGNVVELYAHSYLCYGMNQARLRRQVKLLGDYDQVEDPCTAILKFFLDHFFIIVYFSALQPPHARRVMSPTGHPCLLLDADWCLQSDGMPNPCPNSASFRPAARLQHDVFHG